MRTATLSSQLRFHVYWEHLSLRVRSGGMPRGTSSDFLQSCSLSRKRKRSRSKSWTRVSNPPIAVFKRHFLFTRPSSLFCANADSCGIPDQGAAAQHQEVHLPHEGRSYAAALRTRRCYRGEALCTRWRRPRMSVYRHSLDRY